MKRKLLFLTFWIAGIIFPFGALTLLSRAYARWFKWIFASEVLHIAAHLLLFAVLAVALAVTFAPNEWGARARVARPSKTLSRLLLIWFVVTVVAALQEALQLMYKARPLGVNEWFDIGVDVLGAAMGLFVLESVLKFRA
jgi:hypothetical protein